jgi:hypothetical protein
MTEENDENAVGYKHPPQHTRFKPGQSGNPTGGEKHVRNFRKDLLEELEEKISVRESGREMKISKQRAFIKALVAAAIKGDMRATNALVSFCTRDRGTETEHDQFAAPSAEDLEIIEAFVDRERKRRSAAPQAAQVTSINSNTKRKSKHEK